jgi:hypothetical protein
MLSETDSLHMLYFHFVLMHACMDEEAVAGWLAIGTCMVA